MTERERLIELLKEADKKWFYFEDKANYLLENGVIVPPCKVGDNVYQLDSAGDIYKSEVTQVVYNTKGIAFDERAIGKFVFLTREEAEKAIAERCSK